MEQSSRDYLDADATDRRVALTEAVALADAALEAHKMARPVLAIADEFYWWLRDRDSLRVSKLVITHGPVTEQGS
jgi:hypothetical protein